MAFSLRLVNTKSLFGSGSLGFVNVSPNNENEDGNGWDYDLLYKIFNNDTLAWNENVKYHLADQGDMYCFNGNVTMHMINNVIGSVDRVVFVTAFSEYNDFKHKDSVNEFNIWGQYNN